MSRGRKSKSGSIALNWQEIFHKNVGVYFQTILIELGKSKKVGVESGLDLIKKMNSEKAQLGIKVKNLPSIKQSEIPFKIPKNWVWTRLGEVTNIVRGGSPRPAGDLTYYEGNIPFLKVGDLTNGDDIYLEQYTYTIKEAGLYKTRFVEANTLMLTNSGATLGYPKICTFPTTFNDGIAAFLDLSEDFDKVYLFYFLKSLTKWFLKEASRGQGQPNLNTDIIGFTLLPVPPKKEQQLIVAFLDDLRNNNLKPSGYYFDNEVEQKIVNLHKSQLLASENFTLISEQLTLIENLNQAILQEAVQGKLVSQDPTDEPASKLLERIKAEKAKSGKKEKPLPPIKPEEIPFDIPESWVWCRLGEICDEILGGFAFDSTRYSKSETIHQVIRLGNVKPNQLVLETSPVFIDETYATEVSKALLQVNDVLITMTGTKAKKDYLFSLCLAPNDLQSKKLYLNQRVGCFRFGNNIYSEFINFVLKDSSILKPVFDSSTGAANQANIGMMALKEVLIPLPPLSEQQRIVAEIEKQFAKTKELKAHIIANQEATEQLLKALLHGAFEVEDREVVA